VVELRRSELEEVDQLGARPEGIGNPPAVGQRNRCPQLVADLGDERLAENRWAPVEPCAQPSNTLALM
jgi:hypothetical protein